MGKYVRADSLNPSLSLQFYVEGIQVLIQDCSNFVSLLGGIFG